MKEFFQLISLMVHERYWLNWAAFFTILILIAIWSRLGYILLAIKKQ